MRDKNKPNLSDAEVFSKELIARLKAIDIDPQILKPTEIYKRLGLSKEQISYETLRKILHGLGKPSEQTKNLLWKVTASDTPRSASGKVTCALVKGLLKSGTPYFMIEPWGDADLVLDSKLAYGYRHLVRCLDDTRPNDAEQTYILKHALTAHNDIKNLNCASATLLTHLPLPNNESVKLPSQIAKDVSVVTVAEFVSRFLNLENCRAELTNRLKAHGISAEGTDSLVLYGSDNKGNTVDILKEIWEISGLVSNNAEGPNITQENKKQEWSVCVIAGMPGTGKTTLCLTAALQLLNSYIDENRRTAGVCFPVIIRGRDILTPQHIPGAIKDAIETLYDASLPQTIVDEMIDSGRLLLFIDGLNESVPVLTYSHLTGVLGHLPHAFQDNSKYILTLRPGTLTHEEQKTATNNKAVSWISLDAPDQSDPDEKRQAQEKAQKKLEKPLGMYIFKQLESSSEIGQPLLELARTPFFIRALSTEKAKSFLNDLLSTTLTEEGSQARNETFYRLVEFLASQWVTQVLSGISDPDNQGVTRAREEDFAKLLVQTIGTSFFLAWDKGTHSMNMMLSYDELIERLEVKGTALHKDKEEERRVLSERLLKASALLVRSEEKCRLSVPADILRDFFLAQYFADAILLDSAQNPEEEIIKRLGQAPLNWEQRLVSFFMVGRLRAANRQSLISDLLKEVATESPRKSVLKQLLLAQPGKSYLLQNLIFLNVTSKPYQDEMRIDLSDVSIAGADLSHIFNNITPNKVLIEADRSNLEFVRLTSRADVAEHIKVQGTDCLDKPLWSGPLVAQADIHALVAYCRKTKTLAPEPNKLNKWLVVPGGAYRVGSYENPTKNENDAQETSVMVSSERIGLTSFAIQLNPVTNGDFLRFLQEPGNEKWSWKVQRPETRNDYYLRGWDAKIEQFKDKDDVKLWKESQLNDDDWLNKPLVYVSWRAANAYARFYGLSLPTEAQFEVAARYFQDGEAFEDDPVCEYPWGKDLVKRGLARKSADEYLKGYALYRDETNSNPSLYPPFVVSEDEGLEEFNRWADETSPEGLSEISPARHLLGGVRQWMADIWSPVWPPYKEKLDGIIVHPYQDGWAETHPRLGYEQRNRWRQERHRVLRGGSYHWKADQLRISYRDAQRETNVNHDVGFRCVKKIWPNKP